MEARSDFDIDMLSRALSYNPETGDLTWKISRGKAKAGSKAGCPGVTGYIKITFMGRTYVAHRIAWAIFYREPPPSIVDHVNGQITDNRIVNLRSGDRGINQQNQRSSKRRNSSSVHLGVSKFKGKWRAKIYHGKKYIFLGYHDSEEDAANAYLNAKRNIHKGCAI